MKNLYKSNIEPDPLVQFRRWYSDAVKSGHPEPSAMNLSTATTDGKPSLIEFWLEQPNRLHDRILYRLEQNRWRVVRLAP